jgi:hypothetical protein
MPAAATSLSLGILALDKLIVHSTQSGQRPMNGTVEQLVAAFEALSDADKHQVANVICRAHKKALMDEAYATVRELLDEAHKNAERMVEGLRLQAANDLQAERQRLMRDIELARGQAMQELVLFIRDRLGPDKGSA